MIKRGKTSTLRRGGLGIAIVLAVSLSPVLAPANAVSAPRLVYSTYGYSGYYEIHVGPSTAEAGPASTLVADLHDAWDPTVSPDGTKVAYASDRSDSSSGIWVVPINGSSDPVAITGPVDAYDYNPTWSPDGRTIAFDRTKPGGTPAVHVVHATGGPSAPVKNGASAENPSFTPSGRELVVGVVSGARGVAVIDVTTGTRRVIAGTTGGRNPQVSPDGTTIAFAATSSTVTDDCTYDVRQLATVPYAGGAVRRSVAAPWLDSPTWWPGGTHISVEQSEVSEDWGCPEYSLIGTYTSAGVYSSRLDTGEDVMYPGVAAEGGIARPVTAPAPPTGLARRAVASGVVALSWKPSTATDIYEYVVVRGPAGGVFIPSTLTSGAIVYRGSGTSATIRGLRNGSIYPASVFAIDRAGTMSRYATLALKPQGAPKVSFKLSKAKVKLRKKVTFSGTIKPAASGDRVRLQRFKDGKWRTYRTAKASTTGKYSITWKTNAGNDMKWRVYLPATNAHPKGFSPVRKLKVDAGRNDPDR